MAYHREQPDHDFSEEDSYNNWEEYYKGMTSDCCGEDMTPAMVEYGLYPRCLEHCEPERVV